MVAMGRKKEKAIGSIQEKKMRAKSKLDWSQSNDIYASLFTMKGSKQIKNKKKNLTNYSSYSSYIL